MIPKSFVVYRDCVYSADYKTLVHAPEATELVVLPFVEHMCSLDSIKIPHSVKYIGNKSLQVLPKGYTMFWTGDDDIPQKGLGVIWKDELYRLEW